MSAELKGILMIRCGPKLLMLLPDLQTDENLWIIQTLDNAYHRAGATGMIVDSNFWEKATKLMNKRDLWNLL